MSRDEENEYFADGLSEELLNVLAKIRALRVASRTSAFYFKGKDVGLATVAQKLNVVTILEGSVRKSGKRVRITAQLIDVSKDSHLWSETYDRELEDIFAVQEEIARSVVTELRVALLGEVPDALVSAAVQADVAVAAKGRGENAEAYRLYLEGQFFGRQYTQASLAKGIECYQRALEADPAYALAWAGLSFAYAIQGTNTWAPQVESCARAREAAERALQLEPDLPEGHVALGRVRKIYEWDWKGAAASFRRALELAPKNESVVSEAAALERTLGQLEEAVALNRCCVTLDPLNASTHYWLGRNCLSASLLDEAEAELRKALELSPQAAIVSFELGCVHMAQGRMEEALEAMEREPTEAWRLLGHALAHHAMGRTGESDATMRVLIEKYAGTHAFQIAEGYAYRGEVERAFEWLERAYAQRDTGLGSIKVDYLLRDLHGDPRWRQFLEKIGLAD